MAVIKDDPLASIPLPLPVLLILTKIRISEAFLHLLLLLFRYFHSFAPWLGNQEYPTTRGAVDMVSKQFLVLASIFAGCCAQTFSASDSGEPTEAPSSTMEDGMPSSTTTTGHATHTINVGAVS